jgi:hypothetical protein
VSTPVRRRPPAKKLFASPATISLLFIAYPRAVTAPFLAIQGGNAAEKGVDAVTDAGGAVADKAREAVDTIKDKIDNASKWPETDTGKGSSS